MLEGKRKKGLALVFFGFFILEMIFLFRLKEDSPLVLQSRIDEASFTEFLLKYSKSYSGSEYLKRFSIFKENSGYIRVFNSQRKAYYLSITFFTDLSNDEFKSIYLSSRSSEMKPEKIDVSEKSVDFPTSINWLDLGAVTPVKNQGACGDGWAFATTGAVESAWFISKNTLTSLSEQQLLDCSPNYGCSSGWPSVAMQYIINNGGITSDSNYAYVGFQEVQCNLDAALIIEAKIKTYSNVYPNNYQALASAVSQQPISVLINAGGPDWQNYGGGILDDSNCGPLTNHALLIVGYNFTGPLPYWICKNSWGESWGEEGYIRIASIPGAGICGIQTSPSYPIV
jgi:C1A family cysteine protease